MKHPPGTSRISLRGALQQEFVSKSEFKHAPGSRVRTVIDGEIPSGMMKGTDALVH
jgi:hypothetical protein